MIDSHTSQSERIAVVGAGIVGLAHAWQAAKQGHEVLLFERDPEARGASIRNFGMVWPIGQPNGPHHRLALRSRQLWLELLDNTKWWHSACGSLHLAYREDECHVLKDFADLADELAYDCQLLSPQEVSRRSPAAKLDGLLAGLWSPTEVNVDPRQLIRQMPAWLESQYDVKLHFGVPIQSIHGSAVISSQGQRWNADRVVVAAGKDAHTLYPEIMQETGVQQCKLQMMRTAPQPDGWRLGPMIAGGLTLRHYDSFAVCSGLKAVSERIARETPLLDKYGIHVMASQNEEGEVILGDSHEYAESISPFYKTEIESLILEEIKKLIDLPDWTIRERWQGVYAKIPGTIQFLHQPHPRVMIDLASGGCGMTMSFALAEQAWQRWDREAKTPYPIGDDIRAMPAESVTYR